MSGRIKRSGVAIAYLIVVGLLAGGVWWYGYVSAIGQSAQKGASDLALAADRLTSQLQRYRELAVFLADHPKVRGALSGDGDDAQAVLLETMDKTGSLGIIVIGPDGQERAAAEGRGDISHAGAPYFERALDGAIGVYHTVADRYRGPSGDGKRAFYFAAPIFSESGPVAGVVLVAADVEAIEAEWRGGRPAVLFTDSLGVVYLTNRSEILFSARGDTDAARLDRTAGYPAGSLRPYFGFDVGQIAGHEIWRLDAGRYLPARALHLSLDVPTIDLTAEALVDLVPARQLATLQAAAVAALCLAFGAILYLATERRRTLAEANQRLEERVARRTAELQDLNTDLRREVAERRAAEEQLTRTQAELVQAGKLSALGQMSAGISHELNQPLMAIRSFAENAEAFIDRGTPERAKANLSRISELGRRMGRIIKNLRSFSRHESEPPSEVDLVAVVDAALEIAAPRAHQAGVEITWEAPPGAVYVHGGEVRLQQVTLNLLGNAIDAMDNCDPKRIDISLMTQDPARVRLVVRDTGPGIAEPDKIFDPFYSTKLVGEGDGMGLGLSISYGLVQSFGGAIIGRNHPGGGAEFEIELDRAKSADAA